MHCVPTARVACASSGCVFDCACSSYSSLACLSLRLRVVVGSRRLRARRRRLWSWLLALLRPHFGLLLVCQRARALCWFSVVMLANEVHARSRSVRVFAQAALGVLGGCHGGLSWRTRGKLVVSEPGGAVRSAVFTFLFGGLSLSWRARRCVLSRRAWPARPAAARGVDADPLRCW